jgi:hypothetical protein
MLDISVFAKGFMGRREYFKNLAYAVLRDVVLQGFFLAFFNWFHLRQSIIIEKNLRQSIPVTLNVRLTRFEWLANRYAIIDPMPPSLAGIYCGNQWTSRALCQLVQGLLWCGRLSHAHEFADGEHP